VEDESNPRTIRTLNPEQPEPCLSRRGGNNPNNLKSISKPHRKGVNIPESGFHYSK